MKKISSFVISVTMIGEIFVGINSNANNSSDRVTNNLEINMSIEGQDDDQSEYEEIEKFFFKCVKCGFKYLIIPHLNVKKIENNVIHLEYGNIVNFYKLNKWKECKLNNIDDFCNKFVNYIIEEVEQKITRGTNMLIKNFIIKNIKGGKNLKDLIEMWENKGIKEDKLSELKKCCFSQLKERINELIQEYRELSGIEKVTS